jgi:preprotein translocase subunit SecF
VDDTHQAEEAQYLRKAPDMLIKFWPMNTKIPFMKFRYVGVVFSLLMIGASIFFIYTRGLNLGVDFAGGSVLELKETSTINVSSVRGAGVPDLTVNSARLGDGQKVVVVRFGNLPDTLLGAEYAALPDAEKVESAPALSKAYVVNALKAKFGLSDADFIRQDTVGPKVSAELFRDSIIALAVALLMMLIYIALRYKWNYGLGGVVSIFHDAIGTIGLFAATQMEFNLTTVAALLTIIGYSINDTVVVFDRVREERRKYKTMPATAIIDMATNQTLSRTFLTGGTTLLAIFAIYFFGGPVLNGLSVALIWGIVIGTYSSIFVASAIVIWMGIDIEQPDKKKVEGFQVPQ